MLGIFSSVACIWDPYRQANTVLAIFVKKKAVNSYVFTL